MLWLVRQKEKGSELKTDVDLVQNLAEDLVLKRVLPTASTTASTTEPMSGENWVPWTGVNHRRKPNYSTVLVFFFNL